MIIALFLSSLAPIIIYLGLEVLNSISLTFILFYGIICILIPLFDFSVIKKYSKKEISILLGFENTREGCKIGIAIGIILLVVIVLFLSVFKEQVINVERINALLNKWNLNSINPVLFLLLTILANSILEEIYWRGYIFYKLKEKTNVVNVIILTSLFYCSYHFITTINLFSLLYAILFTILVFSIGIFWGYMRYKFRSIYIPIISHLFADLGIMLIYIKHFS